MTITIPTWLMWVLGSAATLVAALVMLCGLFFLYLVFRWVTD